MKKYSKLPHIDIKNGYQFITFRTYDSVDSYILKLQNLSSRDSIKQYNIDRYLDFSKKGAYLYGEAIRIIKDIIFEYDNKLYKIIAFVIMPNHIHILLQQFQSLSKIVKTIKGKSAILLNNKLNKNGKFWANGYYDKAIRDENHYITTLEYIVNNPIKANLKDAKERVFTIYN